MEINFTCHRRITRLAVLALSALCFLQVLVRAQGMTGVIIIFPSVGLAPDQRLRLTLFNRAGDPLRAQAQIHHSGGILVGLGDGSVRAGAFHSFDFNRSDIPLAGEDGTGRLQLRASFRIEMAQPRKKMGGLAVSMETISISDGTSNTVFVGEVLPSRSGGSGNDTLNSGFGNDIMMGIVPGRTLRVTLFNLPSFGSETESEAQHNVRGHVKVFDGTGNLIAQSPEQVIPSGEFRSFNFNHNEILLPGEPDTNRAQVRIKPFFTFESKRLSPLQGDDLLLSDVISFEVIDNSTGKTVTLAGQQCLVFFLGGRPGN